ISPVIEYGSELMSIKHQQLTAAQPANAITAARSLQRKCACGTHTVAGGECKGCSKQRLQRRAARSNSDVADVPPIVHEVLHSSGQPLDEATRDYFEPRFNHDFSHVRVHTDAK